MVTQGIVEVDAPVACSDNRRDIGHGPGRIRRSIGSIRIQSNDAKPLPTSLLSPSNSVESIMGLMPSDSAVAAAASQAEALFGLVRPVSDITRLSTIALWQKPLRVGQQCYAGVLPSYVQRIMNRFLS